MQWERVQWERVQWERVQHREHLVRGEQGQEAVQEARALGRLHHLSEHRGGRERLKCKAQSLNASRKEGPAVVGGVLAQAIDVPDVQYG